MQPQHKLALVLGIVTLPMILPILYHVIRGIVWKVPLPKDPWENQ